MAWMCAFFLVCGSNKAAAGAQSILLLTHKIVAVFSF